MSNIKELGISGLSKNIKGYSNSNLLARAARSLFGFLLVAGMLLVAFGLLEGYSVRVLVHQGMILVGLRAENGLGVQRKPAITKEGIK